MAAVHRIPTERHAAPRGAFIAEDRYYVPKDSLSWGRFRRVTYSSERKGTIDAEDDHRRRRNC